MFDESQNLPPEQTSADATRPESMAAAQPPQAGGPQASPLASLSASAGQAQPADIPQGESSQQAPQYDRPTPEVESAAIQPSANTAEEPQSETTAEEPHRPTGEPAPAAEAAPADSNGGIKKDWYILKVQSNREDAIAEGLQRRVAIAGLQDYFGEIIVPTEMVTEFKNGKKRVVKRKLYPGYIVVNMAITDDTWFLVRDTPGIGDFTGSGGKPIPMQPHEVAKLIAKQEEKTEEQPRLKISFKAGDRVKINEGTFENFEGEVENIDETNGRVTVMINIFGRSTPVELEYWQIESV